MFRTDIGSSQIVHNCCVTAESLPAALAAEGLRSHNCSINSHSCLGGELAEWTNTAHAVPRVLVAGPLTLAFVSFQKTGNEGFASQRCQSHATGFAVIYDIVRIFERDHFDDGARLGLVICCL